jgi:hypothetical protein
MKTCPSCKLLNTDEALRCDCGYDFARGIVVPDVARGGSIRGQPETGDNLWKQVVGLGLASLIVLVVGWPGSVLVVAVGALVFADAWTAGIRKDPGRSSFLNLSPMAWAICVEGLFHSCVPTVPGQ